MTDTTTFLSECVAACRAEIERLRLAIALQEAELGAYEAVLRHVEEAPAAVAAESLILQKPKDHEFAAKDRDGAIPAAAAPEPAKARPTAEAKATPDASRGRSRDLDDHVRSLWHAGHSVADIADELRVSSSRVYQIKLKLGLPNRAPLPRKPVPASQTATDPAPQVEAEPRVEPAPAPPAPAGEPVASTDDAPVLIEHAGITITGYPRPGVRFRGRVHRLSSVEAARMLAVLVRAAPHPVNRAVVHAKCHPRAAAAHAEELLAGLIIAARPAVEAAGLRLNDMKGIGVSITGTDDADGDA